MVPSGLAQLGLGNGRRLLATAGRIASRRETTMPSDRPIEARITRRRFSALSAVGVAAAVLPLGYGLGQRVAQAQSDTVITMVTDTAGLGDQNFNDLANKGGTQAAAEFGFTWKVIESADPAQYIPNLTAGAEQGELTVGVGFLLTDAITEVANQFPDDNFLLIDSVSEAANVRSVTFKENEPAFLAGVVAGQATKTNKLGIVGGQRIPPVIRYEVGFVAGVKSVNPNAEINIAYADTFGDPPKGKELALAQYEQGADIILPIAGATGIGCYQAAAEKGDGVWVVGADTSQEHLAPGRELCTAQKGVDFAVYTGCKDVVNDTFTGGAIDYDLKTGGVSLQTIPGRVPDEYVALARGYEKLIVEGTLVVPVDDETLAAFTPPERPEPVAEASPAATPST
ncbi:MAG: basic rane protein [Thermomicrobiales bacterium]|jgi:basic membrane protein A|nr:basic rane protein [Thermomicrobiales bacterium]